VGDVSALAATPSDAHESNIVAEALGLASNFLPRNRLAPLEPYSITLAYSRHSFSVLALFLTPLDATRRHSLLLAREPHSSTTLDSPHTRLQGCQ
jgi:hypothetical protein